MELVGALLGGAAVAMLVMLAFGLVTGRIDWRAQGCCCPADPAKDLRMRDAFVPNPDVPDGSPPRL